MLRSNSDAGCLLRWIRGLAPVSTPKKPDQVGQGKPLQQTLGGVVPPGAPTPGEEPTWDDATEARARTPTPPQEKRRQMSNERTREAGAPLEVTRALAAAAASASRAEGQQSKASLPQPPKSLPQPPHPWLPRGPHSLQGRRAARSVTPPLPPRVRPPSPRSRSTTR